MGVALVLVGGIISGHSSWGVLASLGALYAGFVSFRGTYAARFRTMISMTVVMALLTYLGSVASPNPIAGTVCVAVVAFILALFAGSGNTGLVLSIQGTAVVTVLAGIHASGAQPLGNALLVFAGGAVQILILTLVWPLSPRYPERRAVDRVYLGLAQFVRAMRMGENPSIPDAQLLQEARELMTQLKHQPQDITYALRVAETIRAGLVGLARCDRELRKLGPEAVARAESVAIHIESALRRVSQAIRQGLLDIKVHIEPSENPAWSEHERWVRLVADSIIRLGHRPNRVRPIRGSPGGLSVRSLFRSDTLRNLSLEHAARYATVVGAAFGLSRLWQVPHAYWLPLSVCILLRPDYATTLDRGVARLVGTIAGVIVASAVATLHPSSATMSVLVLAVTWICYSVYLANYTVFTAAITCYVVFSLSAGGVTQHGAPIERLLATIAGAAIAVAANFAWPIWQSRKVADVLRDGLIAQIGYSESLLSVLSGAPLDKADQARFRARTLRLEAERVVQAAEVEPNWGRAHVPDWADDVLNHIDENAAVLLSIHAEAIDLLIEGGEGDARPRERIEAVLKDSRRLLESLSGRSASSLVSATTQQANR